MRTPALAGLALVLAASLAACGGYAPTALPSRTPAPSSSASPPPKCPSGETDSKPGTPGTSVRSYDPMSPMPTPGQMPAGSTMAEIQKRGKLVAGVSADQYLLGFFDPVSGKEKGFDIDMVHEIAKAIWGTDKGHVQPQVITSADRIPALESGDVDIVARNMTINCSRWTQIAFSAEYFASGQKVLTDPARAKEIHTLADLADLRVCAPAGTTSLDNLESLSPKAVPVVTGNDAECLIAFQNGQADAVTTDDTVLAGMAAQDPYAVVADTGQLTAEPYGIGVNAKDVDLVRFINGVLEQMDRDGTWQKLYDKWFLSSLDPATMPPRQYGRTP